MMAKFHKEMPFLHKNDLLNGIVQVSEWNLDPTSLQMLLIMAISSKSASVNLRVTYKASRFKVILCYVI